MLRRLEIPAEMCVTLEDAKAHLRVDHDVEDDVISSLLQASIDACADYAARAFDQTVYEYSASCWPCRGCLEIPIAPVGAVSSVKYVDEDGAMQTVAGASWKWERTDAGARVLFDPDYSLPALGTRFQAGGDAIRVTLQAGYDVGDFSQGDDPEMKLPSEARSAIMLMLGGLYANRENVVIGRTAIELPLGVRYLLDKIRVYR